MTDHTAAITITGARDCTIDLSTTVVQANGLDGLMLVDCINVTVLTPAAIHDCRNGIILGHGCQGCVIRRPDGAGPTQLHHVEQTP